MKLLLIVSLFLLALVIHARHRAEVAALEADDGVRAHCHGMDPAEVEYPDVEMVEWTEAEAAARASSELACGGK